MAGVAESNAEVTRRKACIVSLLVFLPLVSGAIIHFALGWPRHRPKPPRFITLQLEALPFHASVVGFESSSCVKVTPAAVCYSDLTTAVFPSTSVTQVVEALEQSGWTLQHG